MIYPFECGLVFLDTPKTEVLINAGLSNLGSPDHVITALPLGDKYYKFNYQLTSIAIHPICDKNSLKQYLSGISIHDIVSSYIIRVNKVPRKILSVHGRPQYCHNYVIQLLGLELHNVFTVEHFESELLKHDGKRNYDVMWKYPEGRLPGMRAAGT